MEATELFERAIGWLQENYANFQFFVERDIVWTIQTYLIRQIKEQDLPYKVFNDFPILPGNRRSLSADLAILASNKNDLVEVAVEFKYEPSHERSDVDIWHTKLTPSVVFWGSDGVAKDVERVQEFVAKGKARVAFAVFIDEDGYFSHRPPHLGSKWIHWNTMDASSHNVSVLWSRVPNVDV